MTDEQLTGLARAAFEAIYRDWMKEQEKEDDTENED